MNEKGFLKNLGVSITAILVIELGVTHAFASTLMVRCKNNSDAESLCRTEGDIRLTQIGCVVERVEACTVDRSNGNRLCSFITNNCSLPGPNGETRTQPCPEGHSKIGFPWNLGKMPWYMLEPQYENESNKVQHICVKAPNTGVLPIKKAPANQEGQIN